MSAASCHDHRGRAAVGLAITALLGVAAGPALAHVVYGTPPLSLLTQESDLVARVRIIDPHSDLPLAAPLAHEIVVGAEVHIARQRKRASKKRLIRVTSSVVIRSVILASVISNPFFLPANRRALSVEARKS